MEEVLINISRISKAVEVQRKKIKNVHLKVYRDLRVKISVPLETPNNWVNSFVIDKTDWIAKQLYKYERSGGYNNLQELKSGSSTQMFGKDSRIMVCKGNTRVVRDEKAVTITLLNVSDELQINRMFEKWWRELALKTYSDVVDNMMPIFNKHNIQKPQITIKKMKTLWGSCNKALNKITINEYLLKADIRCIEYVILHELTHLIHNGHNKAFYDFLTIYMPDWQERKKELDLEVVQGL